MQRFFLLLVFLALLAGQSGCRSRQASRFVFPGKEWEQYGHEESGFDMPVLQKTINALGGHGCIVRRGRMVSSWGRPNHALDIASAVKPLYAHFVYMLIQDGRIDGLDDAVVKFEPGLASLNKDLGFKDRLITWRHLITQTSCYGMSEEPGSAFDYSDYQSALLIDTIVYKVCGTGYSLTN